MDLDKAGIYFNIGFRAATSEQTLIKVKESKYNIPLLEDAYKIVNNCEKSWSGKWKYQSLEDLREGEVYGKFFFWDFHPIYLINKQKALKRIKDIKETKNSLEKLIKKEKVSKKNLNKGIKLFNELQKFCLCHNTKSGGCYP